VGQPVTFNTDGGEPAETDNIYWIYDDDPNNILDLEYTTFTDVTVTLIDVDGYTITYSLGVTDDTPPGMLNNELLMQIYGYPVPVLIDDFLVNKAGTGIRFGSSGVDLDTDDDGMRDRWEEHNGLDVGTDDSDSDADSDGATNIEEYYAGTDPQRPDTDLDGLNDGFELEIVAPNNLYYTDPRMKDTDSDGLDDFEEVYLGNDNYKTNPTNPHSDSDTWNDKKESDEGTNPNDPDTDSDDLPDDRDNQPLLANRRFMFIFEVNEYSSESVMNKHAGDIANDMDDEGWNVYIYSDHDYSVNAGVDETLYDSSKGYCTWGNFQSAWQDFDDLEGNKPQGNGKDLVFVYLEGHGQTNANIWSMYFYRSTGGDQLKSEIAIRDVMDTLDDAVDVIWLNTDDSVGAVTGLGPLNDNWYADDEIGADACIYIVTDADFGEGQGDMVDGLTLWDDFYSDYGSFPQLGFDTAWTGLDDHDNHGIWDNYFDYDEFYLW
jgi:hypothetical protein